MNEEPSPISGLAGYTSPAPDGKGVIIDTERMALDLITILKADGWTKDQFTSNLGNMFDNVQVSIKIPAASKN
jgi:hypothetical protein